MKHKDIFARSLGFALVLAGFSAASARPAGAQPTPKPTPPSSSSSPVASAPPPPVVATAVAAPPARPKADDALVEALRPRAGGLTPDDAAKAAAAARPSVRVKQEELTAAAARVDQALISYYPKLSLTATYTRSSPVEGALNLGPPAVVGANRVGAALTTGACPAGENLPGQTCVFEAGGDVVRTTGASFNIPPIVSSYSVVASVSLPISDWVLRASQGLAAAAHAESAKTIELEAERLKVAADAKITYFNWVRAKGQVAVTKGAVAQAKAHLDDARRVFEVGLLSKADALRFEAQVASAELVEVEAAALAALVERQLRQTIGKGAEKSLEVGIDVIHAAPVAPTESLDALIQQAIERRLEVRALDETQFALKSNEAVTRAGYFPRVEAFADGSLANPNARIFPQQQQWDFTWDAGLRVTWVVSDTFATAPAVAEARARTAAVAAQRSALVEGLEIEVASAYSDLKRAQSSIEATERGLSAAEESLRVRSELFRSGKASSVELIDAETEVTRGHLRRLDAHVGLLVAKTRLDHATGRDVKDLKDVKAAK